MGRGNYGCGRCGGQTRRLSQKNIVGYCFDCHDAVCQKHYRWNSAAGQFLCTACDRKRG